LKAYEPGMRHLIDTYIAAKDSKKLIEMNDFSLLNIIEYYKSDLVTGRKKKSLSAAENIENNIRKKIVDQIDINPEYYKRLSAILDQLIKKREMEAIEYSELLNRYIQLAKEVEQSDTESKYPESIGQSKAKRAFYDNYGKDEVLTNRLYEAVIDNIQEGFRENNAKAMIIKGALHKILQDERKVEELFDLICKQEEF
jgi:type I restriction enzyme R subunit